MEYLKRALELAQSSLEAGNFPAGAVLVSKTGDIYESSPSLGYNHSETMIIDKAIDTEGFPLNGAVVYASMQPCLMCLSKMYWAGINEVHYVISQTDIEPKDAFESQLNLKEISQAFFRPISLMPHPELLEVALSSYNSWKEARQ
jgi:tRNA(Arg) A34 adenosine deaminase TadA